MASVAVAALMVGVSADETASLPLGERQVEFKIHQGPDVRPRVVLLSLHANESTCRQVTKKLLPQLGGRYVELQAGGQRRIHFRPGRDQVTIDPNRLFTQRGVALDLRKGAIARPGDAEAALAFGQKLVRTYLAGVDVVVAVHNNTNGGYSIRSYQKGGVEAAAARKVYFAEGQDPDNFFLVTQERDYVALSGMGYHVVWQSASPPDDGSLSVFAAKNGMRYVNVEAEHGAAKVQARMLLDVFQVIKKQ